MPPASHALLGASKAHQWLACPPSAEWETKFVDPGPSEAAEEGTLAHALAEDHLNKTLDGKRITTTKKFKENPLYRPAMEEHVATYCDVVMETFTAMQEAGTYPSIYLETRLDLSEWIPDGFGTADCIIIGEGTLHVFDFKYGKGVPVAAEENPQLKLYGLGALEEFGLLYDISEVVLHIVQPRLESITEWTVSRDVLEKWGKFVVKPIAEKAYNGEGEFNPGEDQCRWCRCKNACRAYNNYMLDKVKSRFNDLGEERLPNELSKEEIVQLLASVNEIKTWANKVAEWAQDQAINHGVVWPGYKIVEGISRRKITNEQKVIDILRSKGYSTEQICSLKGFGDLEDLIGKKTFAELVGEYIEKPKGKPTLVPESDKRPEYNDIKFTEIKENEEK